MRDSDIGRWTHPATILVATDLSDLDHLMPFALEQAGETGARLILLHVLPASVAVIAADASGMPYYDTSSALETAEQMLRPWCEVAARRGIRCEEQVREGHPTQQIAAAVRQFQADRVLLGTRSRSKLGKLLLGSVAEQVLRSVYLPVMTVGPEAHLPVASGEERVVLHATTLRETSRPSAALACRIAATRNAKLILLHVLPPIDVMQRKGMPTGLDSKAMVELRILAEETGAGCCSAVEPVDRTRQSIYRDSGFGHNAPCQPDHPRSDASPGLRTPDARTHRLSRALPRPLPRPHAARAAGHARRGSGKDSLRPS